MNNVQDLHQEKPWGKSFIALTIGYLLLFMCLQMLLSPFPTYAKDQFHAGDFTISLVTSVFALAAIATRFVTAALMRTLHRNVLLFVGVLIAAAATALYSFAGSMNQLLLLRILFGIGFGMSSTILPTLVSEIIPRSRLGEGIGYFGLSTSLAMSIGPLIGLSVLDSYGFLPLTVLGTAAAVLIIPLLLLTKSIPAEGSKPVKTSPAADHGKRVPFNRRILLPAVLNMLLAVTYGGLLGFLALYGKEIQLEHIGLFFLFNAFTVLVIRPISGRVFDSKGHGAVLIPAAFTIIASLLLLSFTHSLPLLLASALLYGLGFGSIQPTTQAWMLSEVNPEQHGTANSLYYNSTDFGVAVGSMLLGVIASMTSYSIMYQYAAGAMALFLILYLLSFTLQSKRIAAESAKLQ
ncbi:MAG: transporter [Paenibacillus sp.]|nr:transporter [Paenibacillus sp.]